MAKKSSDGGESFRRLSEQSEAARRNMQEIIDRIDARRAADAVRRAAEAERRERRRRAVRRLIPFAR